MTCAAPKSVARATVLLAGLTILCVAGCSAAAPEAPSAAAVQTVPLQVLAANTVDYRGRTVRVCGRWQNRSARSGDDAPETGWSLTAPNPPGMHGPHTYSVIVAACRGARPRLTNGCVTGRIAREDGSLAMPEAILVASHVTGSNEWWLHPQCA